jgi:hypothetical protein
MELTDIFRSINVSIESVPEKIRTGSYSVTSDDWAARVHHLIHYQSPWFETGRYDENVA